MPEHVTWGHMTHGLLWPKVNSTNESPIILSSVKMKKKTITHAHIFSHDCIGTFALCQDRATSMALKLLCHKPEFSYFVCH